MKILVLGCKGQLGRCLNDQLKNTDHEVIYTSREQIDIADFQVTKNKILKISPEVIINATAYTAVDKAEEDQETANLINHLAVASIASICKQMGCLLIHVSTDYVFDGKAKIPYKEDDTTNPQGVYGETKLNGELAIQASGCKHIILRTSWVFSEYGNNFLKTMLRLAKERDELSVVGDQVGCPTYAQDIAKTVAELLSQLFLKGDINGVYHYCGNHTCSWYEFAKFIFDVAKKHGLSCPDKIHQIKSKDYRTLAARPKYSLLDCSKIESRFRLTLGDFRDGIESALNGLNLHDK
jgi:dTDP-4-dehydrorhamnose reductase